MSRMMRVVLAVMALAMLLAALGCGATGREAIYGKWSAENENGTLIWDFKQDGNMILSGTAYGDNPVDATFEFVDDDTFSVKIPSFNYDSKADFKIEGDKMTVTAEGESVVFSRVK